MPEKQVIFKGLVTLRKTSRRNTRKSSCPKGFDVAQFWLQRIFLVYIGSSSSNQPHNYVIVTRLTDRQPKSPEGQLRGPLPNHTFTFQLFLGWLGENVPGSYAENYTHFVPRPLHYYCVKCAQLIKPRHKVED